MTVSRREDPSLRFLRSGFGAQVKSTASSSPSYGFGTSSRDVGLKQYVSPEHSKKLPGNNSQGPVYRLYSSMGPQPESSNLNPGTMSFGTAERLPKHGRSGVPGPGAYRMPLGLGVQKESRRASSPRAVFGTCTRDGRAKVYLDAALMKTYYGVHSPPPGCYEIPGAVGKQVISTKESAPGVKIGTSLRALDYQVNRARHLPGPGQYRTSPGIGRQPLSIKRSPPAATFGTGLREVLTKKTFISKEHEKGCFGEATPGPVTAAPYRGTGPQQLSTRVNSPGWGFGSSKRLKDYINDTPGVGSYWA